MERNSPKVEIPRVESPFELRESDSPCSTISLEERRRVLSNVPEEVRFFRKTLNKITGDASTFEGYLQALLSIVIISPKADPKTHNELMKPIVTSFIGMVYEDTENNTTIEIYDKLFINLVKEWSDGQ